LDKKLVANCGGQSAIRNPKSAIGSLPVCAFSIDFRHLHALRRIRMSGSENPLRTAAANPQSEIRNRQSAACPFVRSPSIFVTCTRCGALE